MRRRRDEVIVRAIPVLAIVRPGVHRCPTPRTLTVPLPEIAYHLGVRRGRERRIIELSQPRLGDGEPRVRLLCCFVLPSAQTEQMHEWRERRPLHDERNEDDTEGDEDDLLARRERSASRGLQRKGQR